MKFFVLSTLFALGTLVPASAETLVNLDLPFTTSNLPNPCAGESIDVAGLAHLLLHVTIDNAGGLHGGLHINIEAKGVGDSSGAAYVGGAELNANLNKPGKSYGQEFHGERKCAFKRQGLFRISS
jgi:hypothetical protein